MVRFHTRIENIVASTTFETEIPLEKIVSKYEDVEYEPEQFPGAVYRIRKPRAAALIFGSGKIVCTGARSIRDVKTVLKKVARMVKSVRVKVPKKYEVQIENIVASAKFDARLNLDKIAYGFESAEYEPEQFPGLVYRMTTPKVAFLLFTSGKIICTGVSNVKDVKRSIEKLSNELERISAFVKE
ncbi:MAG: TATA-box-binding protein [Candidatus Aenigmarchaeota archaeon]|nr:TATA-box-binding protein [Candidatus Aenigmarchaeota archaeon]